ncbi:hypothetical protein JXR93_07705 [bacterium]|nr:hypothetical protein [bacterium]
MIKPLMICIAFLSISVSIFGYEVIPKWAFRDPQFGKPLISEISSPLFKMEIGNDRDFDEYNMRQNSDDLWVMAINLGIDIPILSFDFGQNRAWGFALTLPVSTNILVDMFEPKTAPLLNQDYKFGAPKIALIKRFSDYSWFKNISFTLLPMFHECTHIGDEITIYRTDVDLPIIRINISYEFTEFAFTINDPENIRENLHTLRIGGVYRLTDEGYGWFKIDQEADIQYPVDIAHSNERFEYYINYQFQRTKWFLASEDIVNIFAIEARHRLRYNHPTFYENNDTGEWTTIDKTEGYEWSFNIYFGWYFYPERHSNKRVGLFFRHYQGVAPYGQMRNYSGYRFTGFTLSYNP